MNDIEKLMNEQSIPLIVVESENPTISLNWTDEIYQINTGIPDKLPPIAKRIKFTELCNTDYPYHSKIYTDGSKTQDGVGCSVHSNNINLALCLTMHLSIISAEAFAIIKALDHCSTGLNVIFSDSKSVLEAVANNNSRHPWIDKIRNILHMKQGSTALCWVPAHVNIAGNENADRLAKEGASQKDPIDIKIPFDDFKRMLNDRLTTIWCEKWNRSNSKLREIKNTPFEWPSSYANDRHTNRIITRLRIGHTKLTHGHFAKREEPAMCSACGTRVTVKHILIDCRIYDKERQKSQLSTSLHEILGDDVGNLQKAVNFLKETKLNKLL